LNNLACHAKRSPPITWLSPGRVPTSLLARLRQNEDILRTFNRATLAVNPGRRITPAAEWLLDNFYLIEEQIQMAKRHLPHWLQPGAAPLLNGPCTGLPRVYDIVLELISHVDAQLIATPLMLLSPRYQRCIL